MSICTITAEAKDVYFATHRFVQNEYGELLPRSDKEAYCPTRIEVDFDAKTLLIKTKTHGTASYTFNYFDLKEKFIIFYNVKGEQVGGIEFRDFNYSDFNCLIIRRKNDTLIAYTAS